MHHMSKELMPDVVDMDVVFKNFNQTKFVGLLEHYKESLCLLHDTLTGTMPAWCDCQGEAWHHVEIEHESHGVQEHDPTGDISEEDAIRIHELTASDHKLYRAATRRFKAEIAKAETKHGVKLSC